MLTDKKAASDALVLIELLKAKEWSQERIRAAVEALKESYQVIDEAKANRVVH